jgi:hypothetical protein
MRWEGHVTHMEYKSNAYENLVGKGGGKRPLGRRRRKWQNNIKMDLREIRRDGMEWIRPVEDRNKWRVLVDTTVNLRVL